MSIQRPTLLLQIHPSRASTARDLGALETTMQGLAFDQHSALALELAATATARQFLLRADHPAALRHLARQIQARYPQAPIRPASTDPLALAPDEECSAVELLSGAASYLPLRSWTPRDLLLEGADPLLGLLSALSELPPGARAVAQLALLPASPTWSAGSRRRAVEHPLAQERAQQQRGESAPGPGRLIPVFFLILLLGLCSRFPDIFHLPPWLMQAVHTALQGKVPRLVLWQTASLLGGGLGIFALILLGTAVATRLGLGRESLYDQRLVDEKTSRPAYQARLRLYIIMPGATICSTSQHAALPSFSSLASAKSSKLAAFFTLLRLMFRREQERCAAGWQAYQAHTLQRRTRRQFLTMLVASYRQYHPASGGYFRPRWLSARQVKRLMQPLAGGRRFWRAGWAYDLPRSRHLLSVVDIAALWHLPEPQDLAELPFIEPERSRTLLAPAALTNCGGYQLGSSHHAGQSMPVFLPAPCLHQNLLAVASTGKGKSTLFFHLARAHLLARAQGTPSIGGLLLVDFHGDLVNQVLGTIPAELEDQVVLLDLSDRAYPIGLNPLDLSGGQDRDKSSDTIISSVEALWPNSYGARTENFVEYGSKTTAEANLTLLARDPLHGAARQYTLLDIVPLFRRTSFRHALLEQVGDKMLINWWEQYYELLDARQQAEFSSSLVNKLSKFASTRISRHILGQPCSTLDFAEFIREEKIVLINCASGEIGADLAALLGSLLVGLFHTALAGINYQTMLAELRKYGGTFGLATQSLAYLDRLDRTLRATVLANIDHLFAFTMAAEDARLLHLEQVEPEDMTGLPDYTCYARLSLEGRRLPVFSLHLDAPLEPDEAQQRRIQAQSRLRYSRPVGEVEAILQAAQTRQETMQPRLQRQSPGRSTTRPPASAAGEPPAHAPRKRGGSRRNSPETAEPPVPTALGGPEVSQEHPTTQTEQAEQATRLASSQEQAEVSHPEREHEEQSEQDPSTKGGASHA